MSLAVNEHDHEADLAGIQAVVDTFLGAVATGPDLAERMAAAFVQPRQALLSGGGLTEFSDDVTTWPGVRVDDHHGVGAAG